MSPPVTVNTECQHCAWQSVTEYRLVGSIGRCGRCLRKTILSIASGSDLPDTGYELTYRDFLLLVQHDSAERLLERWMMHVEQPTAGFGEDDSAGDTLLLLHLAVQSDAKKQYELYQLAMSLWR